MKILFIGKVKFSEEILKYILTQGIKISGIITDKKKGINSDFSNLTKTFKNFQIPLHITSEVNSKRTIDWIVRNNPDIILCIGWSQLIKKKILSIPKIGVIGYHPAKLPQNRGRHPIIWTLALGLKSTASTFFLMDEGADTGKIISQKKIIVSDNYNAISLYNKLISAAKKQVIKIINDIKINKHKLKFKLEKKNQNSNFWRKRFFSDGKIDWRMNSNSIHNLVRALSYPYPGAFFLRNGIQFNVWKTKISKLKEKPNIEPGKILSVSKKNFVTIKCGKGSIILESISPKTTYKKGEYL